MAMNPTAGGKAQGRVYPHSPTAGYASGLCGVEDDWLSPGDRASHRTPLGSIQTLKRLKPDLFRQDWIVLLELLQQQKIKPLIAQRFPLAEARHAQELLAKGGVTGKIVLVLNGSSRESGAA